MTECRDWLRTLWSASFKGVPFYFERDEEAGGRGLIIHKFPHRDDPFIEDMGEEPRFFDSTAYVHGDDADTQAGRLAEILAAGGPGSLVIPARGPVMVHAQEFKRTNERDKLGYIAFSVKFVRQGLSGALSSVPLLGNLGFQSADRLASVLASVFSNSLYRGGPDHVSGAAIAGLQQGVAALDALRLSSPVDAEKSALIARQIESVFSVVDLIEVSPAHPDIAALAALVGIDVSLQAAQTIAASIITVARSLGDAMPAESSVRAFAALSELFSSDLATAYLSKSARAAEQNSAASRGLIRLSALTAWAEALLRREYKSRVDGVHARGELVARFERELNDTRGAVDAELYLAIDDLRARIIEYLSRMIADLAPVMTVESGVRLPSLAWAWRLYADPNRGGELVARNHVSHPGMMPLVFQALTH